MVPQRVTTSTGSLRPPYHIHTFGRVKTRIKLSRLSVTSFLRHPICQSQFSLFLETVGTCRHPQGRAGAVMLTCCLTRSQHQVDSSSSYHIVVLASVLVDCCLPLSYHVFCSPCSRSFSAFVFSKRCSNGPDLASFYSPSVDGVGPAPPGPGMEGPFGGQGL
jgi:hypothetical protein